jgi:4'-phosphopantetheinyl transferase
MTAVDRRLGLHPAGLTIDPVFAGQQGRPDLPVDVLAFRLDVNPEAVAAAESLLSQEERQRANRFVQARDRRRYIVARATLRSLLSERLGTEPASIAFRYGAHGKPELAPAHAALNLRFNLSHSDEMAAFALAVGHDIGIDLERVRSMPDLDRLAADTFSARENEALQSVEPARKLLAFFSGWTRKEAFVKALGSGLGYPLDSFDVSLAPDEPARILRLSGEHGDPTLWHMESFSPAAGFVAALVVDARR